MASAALYRGLSPSKNEKTGVKIAAPTNPPYGTRAELHLVQCRHLSALFDTHRFVLGPTNLRAILEGVNMLRSLGPLPAPGWNATAFKIAIVTPMSTNKTPRLRCLVEARFMPHLAAP